MKAKIRPAAKALDTIKPLRIVLFYGECYKLLTAGQCVVVKFVLSADRQVLHPASYTA